MATVSTSWSDGRPRSVTNMGAIVVTSSSEMMRGLVSVTRSVAIEGWRASTAWEGKSTNRPPKERAKARERTAPEFPLSSRTAHRSASQ